MEHSLENFFKIWPEALQKGWKLVPEQQRNLYHLRAPDKHPSSRNNWASVFHAVDLNGIHIIVPHFLYMCYEKHEL